MGNLTSSMSTSVTNVGSGNGDGEVSSTTNEDETTSQLDLGLDSTTDSSLIF